MSCRNKSSGGATAWPLSFFNPSSITTATVSAGRDLLGISNSTVRPAISITGGRRKTRKTRKQRRTRKPRRQRRQRRQRKSRKTHGGFVPSIMGNFVSAASKFVVPTAIYSGYKLLSRKNK
jgi:hypothetical protein